jgi:hypothetical protein
VHQRRHVDDLGGRSGSWEATDNTTDPTCVCNDGYSGGGSRISGPNYPVCFATAHILATTQSAAFVAARAWMAGKLADAQTVTLAHEAQREVSLAAMAIRQATMQETNLATATHGAAEVLERRPPLELRAECGLTEEEIILLGR